MTDLSTPASIQTTRLSNGGIIAAGTISSRGTPNATRTEIPPRIQREAPKSELAVELSSGETGRTHVRRRRGL